MSRRKTTWIRTETITVTTVKMKADSGDHDDEDELDQSLPLHLAGHGSDDNEIKVLDALKQSVCRSDLEAAICKEVENE